MDSDSMDTDTDTDIVFIPTEKRDNNSDSFKWDNHTTKILINEYMQNKGKMGQYPDLKKKKDLWVLITNAINKHNYNLTTLQVQNRMTTLLRAFKKNPNRPLVHNVELDKSLREMFSSKTYTVYGLPSIFADNDITRESETDQQEHESDDPQETNYDLSFISTNSPVDLCKWDEKTTSLLFDEYEEVCKNEKLMAQFKHKHQLWSYVTERLNEHGYIFSSLQIQNRIKTIGRAYRRHLQKSRNQKSGNVKPFHFGERILNILRRSHFSPKTERVQYVDSMPLDENSFSIHMENADDIANIIVSQNMEDGADSALLKEFRFFRAEERNRQDAILKAQEDQIILLREENMLLKENNNLLRQLIEKFPNPNNTMTKNILNISGNKR